MSASSPSSPYHAATHGTSTTAKATQSQAGKAMASQLATPDLSASAGTTPDILTRVVTPQEELPAFDLGPSAYNDAGEGDVPAPSPVTKTFAEAQAHAEVRKGGVEGIPECWGHRGASATFRSSIHLAQQLKYKVLMEQPRIRKRASSRRANRGLKVSRQVCPSRPLLLLIATMVGDGAANQRSSSRVWS